MGRELSWWDGQESGLKLEVAVRSRDKALACLLCVVSDPEEGPGPIAERGYPLSPICLLTGTWMCLTLGL